MIIMKDLNNKRHLIFNLLLVLTFIGFQLFHDSNPHKICNKTQAGMLYTNGSPTGKTGAPGENNCTQCHSGSVNDGSLFSNLSFSGVNGENRNSVAQAKLKSRCCSSCRRLIDRYSSALSFLF